MEGTWSDIVDDWTISDLQERAVGDSLLMTDSATVCVLESVLRTYLCNFCTGLSSWDQASADDELDPRGVSLVAHPKKLAPACRTCSRF